MNLLFFQFFSKNNFFFSIKQEIATYLFNMETHSKLREKIRKIIAEEEQGFKTFYIHGEGGDHFPYEKQKDGNNEESIELEKKSKDLGMEPVSGDGLHQTGANM